MELIRQFIDVFLHLDKHLAEWSTQMGGWLYVLLFAIIFAETGLVVTPFLPGDSLLFTVGALTAVEGSPISLAPVILLLIVAAILGDACNYAIGYRLGEKVFQSETSLLLNKKHLLRTQLFYQKHGGKTIIIARFIPIIRTFAPFVAGIGKMTYARFGAYNVVGGVIWVTVFTSLGHWFGNQAFVKRNFQYVILGIIVLSVLPAVIEYLRARAQAKNSTSPAPNAEG